MTVNFRYAELLRFLMMRENGWYYLPEDMPTLDDLIAERDAIDAIFLPTQAVRDAN